MSKENMDLPHSIKKSKIEFDPRPFPQGRPRESFKVGDPVKRISANGRAYGPIGTIIEEKGLEVLVKWGDQGSDDTELIHTSLVQRQ